MLRTISRIQLQRIARPQVLRSVVIIQRAFRDDAEKRNPRGYVANEPSNTLFIGNLPFSVEQKQLSDIFANYGDIKEIRVPRFNRTGEGKGYGYVEYTSLESAETAMSKENGYATVGGRTLRLDYAQPRLEYPYPRRQNRNTRDNYSEEYGNRYDRNAIAEDAGLNRD